MNMTCFFKLDLGVYTHVFKVIGQIFKRLHINSKETEKVVCEQGKETTLCAVMGVVYSSLYV